MNKVNVIASVEDDSMYYSRWWYEHSVLVDSTFERRERASIAITKVEMDSLMALSQRLMNAPVLTDNYVSCYAGDRVEIELFHGVGSGSVEASVSYVSVADWLALSPLHKKLKSMTFDRFDTVPKRTVIVERP